jgi:hypothetical protein
MVRSTICALLDSIAQQVKITQEIKEVSRQQLELAGGDFSAQVDQYHVLLNQKRDLLLKLQEYQTESVQLQVELCRNFTLEEFVLKDLQDKLDPGEYRQLASSYARLGWILSETVGLDTEIESLIKTALGDFKPYKPHIDSKHAAQAYRSHMKSAGTLKEQKE